MDIVRSKFFDRGIKTVLTLDIHPFSNGFASHFFNCRFPFYVKIC